MKRILFVLAAIVGLWVSPVVHGDEFEKMLGSCSAQGAISPDTFRVCDEIVTDEVDLVPLVKMLKQKDVPLPEGAVIDRSIRTGAVVVELPTGWSSLSPIEEHMRVRIAFDKDAKTWQLTEYETKRDMRWWLVVCLISLVGLAFQAARENGTFWGRATTYGIVTGLIPLVGYMWFGWWSVLGAILIGALIAFVALNVVLFEHVRLRQKMGDGWYTFPLMAFVMTLASFLTIELPDTGLAQSRLLQYYIPLFILADVAGYLMRKFEDRRAKQTL